MHCGDRVTCQVDESIPWFCLVLEKMLIYVRTGSFPACFSCCFRNIEKKKIHPLTLAIPSPSSFRYNVILWKQISKFTPSTVTAQLLSPAHSKHSTSCHYLCFNTLHFLQSIIIKRPSGDTWNIPGQ